MIPIVTPEEMAAIDAAAPESVAELVDRAGRAVARAAIAHLGGTYGRRVLVVAGKGNNGADGRAAAIVLAARGVATTVVEAGALRHIPAEPHLDLIIDAAYGTGLRRPYVWPTLPSAVPILAVDVVSGCDGLTGEAGSPVPCADLTVTFAALKPGLFLGAGRMRHGATEVVDIGLDVSATAAHLVEAADVAAWLPQPAHDRHKWNAAVWAIAGSPGMTGAATLCATAALRTGAGYVRLSAGGSDPLAMPVEAVHAPAPAPSGWPADSDRFGAIAIGPGLGLGSAAASLVDAVLTTTSIPVVVDGDGLNHLATTGPELTTTRTAATVLTPHDGEYERLMGERAAPDRIDAVRRLATTYGAVALLKGPVTIVANPDGQVLCVDAGSAALSTAGTGDVLTGVITSLVAQGLDSFRAAAAGAYLHGRAAHGPIGLLASDLPDAVLAVRRQLSNP